MDGDIPTIRAGRHIITDFTTRGIGRITDITTRGIIIRIMEVAGVVIPITVPRFIIRTGQG